MNGQEGVYKIEINNKNLWKWNNNYLLFFMDSPPFLACYKPLSINQKNIRNKKRFKGKSFISK